MEKTGFLQTSEHLYGWSAISGRWLKRALDILGSIAGLTLCAPLVLVLAVLIKLDSPGPVFFSQIRVGKNGKLFKMFKFRTMTHGSEGALEEVIKRSPGQRNDWREHQKLFQDPRLTRLGRHWRRFSLDEIPQLWNVLKGEMSLVGPRPILPRQQVKFGACFYDYIQVRPGMTGLWQVSGRNLLSFRQRASLDAQYVQSWSIKLDLSILARTLWAVLRAEGAF